MLDNETLIVQSRHVAQLAGQLETMLAGAADLPALALAAGAVELQKLAEKLAKLSGRLQAVATPREEGAGPAAGTVPLDRAAAGGR